MDSKIISAIKKGEINSTKDFILKSAYIKADIPFNISYQDFFKEESIFWGYRINDQRAAVDEMFSQPLSFFFKKRRREFLNDRKICKKSLTENLKLQDKLAHFSSDIEKWDTNYIDFKNHLLKEINKYIDDLYEIENFLRNKLKKEFDRSINATYKYKAEEFKRVISNLDFEENTHLEAQSKIKENEIFLRDIERQVANLSNEKG